MMKLVYPTMEYKDSFLEAWAEYVEARDPFFICWQKYANFDQEKLFNDFYNYKIKPLEDLRNGINLPDGWVPSSIMWLIDNDEFIARIDIRHRLTPHLLAIGGNIGLAVRPSERGKGYGNQGLKLALKHAHDELDIDEALLACDARNEGSYHSILNVLKEYGGRLDVPTILEDKSAEENHSPVENKNNLQLRFWVNTTKE